ncbi:MAG: ATP-binding cassette domain-containing protein [Bacilli bacterium]|nr:ATP-binding cassette domain-containing protein [Bacilli bacterium]
MADIKNLNEKILEVKDLRVSFRTDSGTVKAVRGISFPLYKGRTMAIVGESGSGKSVTSKAILGILANNKIIEDGQIIYDGKDLLKISEEEFTKLRGVKISMIFQDPLSSLNPIMIVGKQLTEAMVLKQKADKKEAKHLLAKVDKLLAAINAKEAKSLALYVKETPKDTGVDLKDYETLFAEVVDAESVRQTEAIAALIPALEDIAAKGFEDLKASEESFKKLYKGLASCELTIGTEKDNEISVFPTIVKTFVKGAKDGAKLIEERAKAMEKAGVSDFYDLPADVRAKLREVITSPEAFKEKLKNATLSLIDHLRSLMNRTDSEKEAITKDLLLNYASAVTVSKSELTPKEAKARAIKMLEEVGIKDAEKRYSQYPFELSGGMRQRIVIAIALCSSPEVLICDEPTTALDVTIQSQILELINKLKKEKNLSIVFITHDLGVVANMADDIAVMYAGKIVEQGTAEDIFYDARHPYTWALLGSVPDLETKEKLNAIPGTPPNMLIPAKGDAFTPRNVNALEIDSLYQPPFFEISDTHKAATWNVDPRAEEIRAPEIVIKRIAAALKDHPEVAPKPTNTKNSILNYIKEVK